MSYTLLSGFRNVIRNGDFMVYQRGAGPFSMGVYGLDGWIVDGYGGTMTVTRATPLPLNAAGAQIVVSGQSAAAHYARLPHKVEDCRTLAGTQVTVSFLAMAATAGQKLAVELEQSFGTGGSPSTGTQTTVGTVTLSTTMTRYTLTTTVPSVVGKTLGTNGNHSLNMSFWVSAGTDYAPRVGGLGIQSGTFTVADVQLEAGPAATPFERLPMQQQLAWCQRYFLRLSPEAGFSNPLAQGFVTTGTDSRYLIRPAVPMRAVFTVAFSAANLFTVWDALADNAVTAMSTWTQSREGVQIRATTSASLVAKTTTQLNGLPGSYIDFSAEL